MKPIGNPTQTDVLREVKKDIGANYNCIQIGYIEEFNSGNQTATIRIAIKKVIEESLDGSKTYKEHPLLMQCPVMTIFGGGSFMNMPIAKGDSCIVLFCDRELDEWLYNGGVQAPVTPRMHDISDAIAIVGIKHYQNSISDFLANGIRISFAADSRIDLTNDQIESIADLFKHNGNMRVTGNLDVSGTIKAGNGATGTFNVVTVQDGIVVSGS